MVTSSAELRLFSIPQFWRVTAPKRTAVNGRAQQASLDAAIIAIDGDVSAGGLDQRKMMAAMGSAASVSEVM